MNCKFIKPDGEQCKAKAIKGSDLCFTHNPDYSEEKALAVLKGGENRKLIVTYGEELHLETAKDIKSLVAETINLVWTGKMPSNSPANSIGFLARVFLDANEQSDLEERIRQLEIKLNNKT